MMKILRCFSIIALIMIYSCENDVDLNGEYKEKPSVVALLDASQDTQFVRVGRVFLSEDRSALELISDANEIYFDSLNVKMRDIGSNTIWPLNSLTLTKDPGLFATENHKVFYTDSTISIGRNYELQITDLNNNLTTATSNVVQGAILSLPRLNRDNKRELTLVSSSGGFLESIIEIGVPNGISKIDAKLVLKYFERDAALNRVNKEHIIPLGVYSVDPNAATENIEITFTAQRFFQSIANGVTGTKDKYTDLDTNLEFRISSADANYAFYQGINGPIDGIAQVRPEFTNIVNGVGIFASRSVASFDAFMSTQTRNQLSDSPITSGLNFRK